MYFSASSLNFSAAAPFGVLVATTWLNLMMIGDCADAGPARANAATDAAASINLRMFPPAFFVERALAPLRTLPVSRTNTEKPAERPLPL